VEGEGRGAGLGGESAPARQAGDEGRELVSGWPTHGEPRIFPQSGFRRTEGVRPIGRVGGTDVFLLGLAVQYDVNALRRSPSRWENAVSSSML
jgi:hypothetical protein